MIPQCYGNSALFAVGKVAWSGLALTSGIHNHHRHCLLEQPQLNNE